MVPWGKKVCLLFSKSQGCVEVRTEAGKVPPDEDDGGSSPRLSNDFELDLAQGNINPNLGKLKSVLWPLASEACA